eukprot:475649_1
MNDCLKDITHLFGGTKSMLFFITEHAKEDQLQSITEIIAKQKRIYQTEKTSEIHYEENMHDSDSDDENINDVQQVQFSLSTLPNECITHTCGYLNKLDINYKYFNKFLKDIQEFKQFEEKLDLENENENKMDECELESKYLIYENMISTIGKIIRYQTPPNYDTLQILKNWICLLPIENDQEEFNAIVENILYFVNEYWTELIQNNNEMRERILFSLLFYLSQFKHPNQIRSYEIIMDYNIDITDNIPKNIPVLNIENILKIKELKNNKFLIKIKAFEKAMDRLQP